MVKQLGRKPPNTFSYSKTSGSASAQPSRSRCLVAARSNPCACDVGCTHAWCLQRFCTSASRDCQLVSLQPGFQSATAELRNLDKAGVEMLLERWQRSKEATRGSLRVTGPLRDGFWVRVLTVLNQGLWAAQKGLSFHVLHNASLDPYYDPALVPTYGPSAWDQYFEPIVGLHAPASSATVYEMDCGAAHHLWMNMASIYPSSMEAATRERERRAAMVRLWARPRREVVEAVDYHWAQTVRHSVEWPTSAVVPSAQPPFVLGVHMRGTDKYLKQPIGPAGYFAMIDAAIGWHEKAQDPERRRRVHILLATDDNSFQQAVLDRYGRERVRMQRGGAVLRATQREAIWRLDGSDLQEAHRRSESNAPDRQQHEQPLGPSLNHRRGLEVLVDTLLLSRCDYLLKSASAVSEFAIYYAPRLALASYDFQIPGAPFPSWASRPALGPGSPHFGLTPATGVGRAGRVSVSTWLQEQSSWSKATLPMRLHPRCVPTSTSTTADSSTPARRLLFEGNIGLYANQIRCLANAIGFSARLGASLVLDERWTTFATSLLDTEWLHAAAGSSVLLNQRGQPAPPVSLSCADAFWCGGPCGDPPGPFSTTSNGQLEAAWAVTTFEWQAARANGQNHLYSGVTAYPWGGEGEASLCGYAMLRPHPKAWIQALQSAKELWGQQDDPMVVGHHQRLQTSSPAAVGAMCNESTSGILLHLTSSATTVKPIAASRFYESVCAGNASPEMLLDASAEDHLVRAVGGAKRIFLATDSFVKHISADWQQHASVDSEKKLEERASGISSAPSPSDPRRQELGHALLDRLWCHNCSPGEAHISAFELQQAAAPVLRDVLLLAAADDFWPTPGSTLSELVCYWRVAWGRERPPHLTSCEQIVRGWGTKYETPWVVPKFRRPSSAGKGQTMGGGKPQKGSPGEGKPSKAFSSPRKIQEAAMQSAETAAHPHQSLFGRAKGVHTEERREGKRLESVQISLSKPARRAATLTTAEGLQRTSIPEVQTYPRIKKDGSMFASDKFPFRPPKGMSIITTKTANTIKASRSERSDGKGEMLEIAPPAHITTKQETVELRELHFTMAGLVKQTHVQVTKDQNGMPAIFADFRCRCGVDGQGRLAPLVFHRLIDCFIPMLPLLKEVTVESTLQHAKLIALVDNSTLPFFKLFGPAEAEYILPPSELSRSRQLLWAPEVFKDKMHLVLTSPTESGVKRRRTSFRPSVVLHEYANRWFGSGGDAARVGLRNILLVQREPKGGRSFAVSTLQRMQEAFYMGHAAGAPVKIYSGTEPLRETLQMFYDAGVFVGFHGAASANLAFAHSTCVLELTVCLSQGGCMKLPNPASAYGLPPPGVDAVKVNTPGGSSVWRSNAYTIMVHNPMLRWHVMALSLEQLLEGNGLSPDLWEKLVKSGSGVGAVDTFGHVCQQLRGTNAANAIAPCQEEASVNSFITKMGQRKGKKPMQIADETTMRLQLIKNLALVELTHRQIRALVEKADACLSEVRLLEPATRPWYGFENFPK